MEIINRIASFWSSDETQQPPFPEQNTMPSAPTTVLEDRQEVLRNLSRLVARGLSNGLVVFGSRGGLGKSRVVLETLRQEQQQPVILNGHVTPLSLYTTLLQNPDRVIVADDAEGLARNISALGILRSALWGECNARRLVTYNSSQLKDVPQSFHFSGQIVLIMNTLPTNSPAWDAVVSRVDQFELDATNQEVIELMRRLADKGFEDKLTVSECHQIVDFIQESASTRSLSLRLLEPTYRKVLFARESGCNWQELVISQLKQLGTDRNGERQADSRQFDIECLREALEANGSVRDAEHAFIAATGKSRATFYRLRKQIVLDSKSTSPAQGKT